jgi:hypothetical protein
VNAVPSHTDDAIVVGQSASIYFLPLVAAQRKVRRSDDSAATHFLCHDCAADTIIADRTSLQWPAQQPVLLVQASLPD